MIRRDRDLEELLARPSDDAAERAESEWLLARDANPAAPAPSVEVARDHAQLEDLLANLPVGRDDDRWQDAVLAATRTEAAPDAKVIPLAPKLARRRWAQAVMATGLLAAAVLAVLVMTRPPRTPAADLQVETRRVDPTRGGPDEVLVGDHLVVKARPHGPSELRVYQGPRTLLLRCPGVPGCTDGDPRWQVDVRVSAPVPHHVILTFGAVVAPPDATMDEYLAAARTAAARVVVYPAIDVH